MDKKETIIALEQQLKRKVISYQVIQDNEIFVKLKDNIDSFVEFYNLINLENKISQQSFEILTIVDFKNGSKIKSHNCITLIMPDESLIRFSSYQNDGIELSRIWVAEQNQRKGKGSFLMNLFFDFLKEVLGFIPTIFLECTGGVGVGQNALSMDITMQTKFFRNWGFRVNDKKLYPTYVNMLRKSSLELSSNITAH